MERAPYSGPKRRDPIDDYEPFKNIPTSLEEQLDENYINMMNKKDHFDRTDERRRQTTRDARNRIRRLTLTNFDKNSKFITLTFKKNLTDIDEGHAIFQKFVRRLKKHTADFKYIAVVQFQKRGAIHYHMICNVPFTPHKTLLNYWNASGADGSVNIKNIADVDNVGAYIVHYMMRDALDPRLKGRKLYLSSQGMDKPIELRGESAELVIEMYLKNKKEVFANSYESEYLGKITYKEYNLTR